MIHKARQKLAVALLSMVGLSAGATNIVLNPGFDQGSEHWESKRFYLGAAPKWTRLGPGMAGTSCAGFYCTSALTVGAYIRQLLPTIAGAQYDLSFWVGSLKGGNGRYSVFWDGAMIDGVHLVDSGPMTLVSFSGLYAGANATLLEVHGRNDPYYISFDDFSVVASAPLAGFAAAPVEPAQENDVPEPAVYALVLAGLALVGLFRRR